MLKQQEQIFFLTKNVSLFPETFVLSPFSHSVLNSKEHFDLKDAKAERLRFLYLELNLSTSRSLLAFSLSGKIGVNKTRLVLQSEGRNTNA